ncbi:MAG: arsenate reductase family protein [Geobacteraceae bacterium]|nr:arsenate reductase family protein [Geobacteraceae bacterium]
MAHITFYTKLGCLTSARQVDLLKQSGHDVEVCDLLAHDWNMEELTSYFGEMPAAAWFNEKSPRVTSGEIIPDTYDTAAALQLMMSDHLLIRRPLMESGGVRMCGFDLARVHAWVGLSGYAPDDDYTGCSRPATTVQQCP